MPWVARKLSMWKREWGAEAYYRSVVVVAVQLDPSSTTEFRDAREPTGVRIIASTSASASSKITSLEINLKAFKMILERGTM